MNMNKRSFTISNGIKTNAKLLRTVQEFLDITDYLNNTYNIYPLWYRGVSHSKYKLVPRVYRDRLWQRHCDYEWWIFTEFSNKARPFIKDSDAYTDLKWYFTMQHYGLPTRLLDWTEASLTALYFAVRNPNHTYMPSVYVLNPYWYDEIIMGKASGEGVVYGTDPNVTSEEHQALLSSYLLQEKECPDMPLCFEPPVIDDRIAAQKSVFTIHGRLLDPFRIVSRDNEDAQLFKIRFSTECAANIKQSLYVMGITEGKLFPGLEGLAKDIKWERDI
jgi:hypothetical protein